MLWSNSITNDYISDLDLAYDLCQWILPIIEELEWYESCRDIMRVIRDCELYLSSFPKTL